MKFDRQSIAFKITKKLWFVFLIILGFIAAIITLPFALFGRVRRFLRNTRRQERQAYDVTLGVHEIAGNLRDIQNNLLDSGCVVRRATDISLSRNIFYGAKPTNSPSNLFSIFLEDILGRCKNIIELWVGLINSSHFYFIWNRSLLPSNFDYPLIKISGASLVIQHCGGDVRCRRLHDAIFDRYCTGIKSGPYDNDNILNTLNKLMVQRWAELFGTVITMRNQATFQTSGCVHFAFPQSVLSKTSRTPNQVPLIIHAPSDRAVKRTDIVLQAISLLKNQGYSFEFQIIEKMRNEDVISILLKADIVVDQPATWPARFAIEGCAAGCCVISGNHFDFIGRPPNPTLQFEADPVLLASTIRVLLENRMELAQRMRMCWEFWEANYSPQVFSDFLAGILEGRGKEFWPLSDQKELILDRCRPGLERAIVNLLYHPKQLSSHDV